MVAMHPHLKGGLLATHLRHARPAPGGAGGAGHGPRAARVRRHRHARGRARPQPLLRRPAPAGDRPRPGPAAQGAAARRADGRHEPAGVRRVHRVRHRVRDEKGIPVLLIEHDMRWSWAVASGSRCSTAAPRSPRARRDDIRNNQRVIEAYLGKAGPAEGDAEARRRARLPRAGDRPRAGGARPRPGGRGHAGRHYGNIAAVKGISLDRATRARSSP